MKFLTTISLSILFLTTSLAAQGPGPTIGLDRLPLPSDPICPIPMADDHDQDFEDVGLDVGDRAPDFKLYDLKGNAFSLGERLAAGRPVLLVNGSYTCPVFRGKVRTINRVAAAYGERIDVVVIYTLEAHPEIDTSVYFGVSNVGSSNTKEKIFYRQPTTYGERESVVQDMASALNLEVPLYLDGPCNEWWSVYGWAPNNAYLIDTNGMIAMQHGWFDRAPHDIDRDILTFLGEEVEDDTTTGGSFTMELISTNLVTGAVNDVLYAEAEITNAGESPVIIDIIRREQQMPEEWATSLCVDVCYATWVDSAQIVVDPGQTQSFTLYFYTGTTPDTARVPVLFRNGSDPENRYRFTFGGVTSGVSGVEEDVWTWPEETDLR